MDVKETGAAMERLAHIAVAIAVCASLGCSERHSPEKVETRHLRPLRVAVRSHLSYAPIYIADAEGFFEEEGLDVELVSLGEVDGRVALEQGEIDAFASFAAPSFFNSVNRGSPSRIVADRGHASAGCAAYAVLASPALLDRGDLRESDLKGLILSSRPASTFEHILDTVLANGGLTSDDVKLVEGIGSSWMDAMGEGRIHIKASAEPHITVALDQGVARIWKSVNDVLPGYQFSLFVYGAHLIQDRDLGNRLMVAYLRGVRQFAVGKTDRNVEIVSRFTELRPELVRQACWAEVNVDGSVNTESLDSFIDWAVSRGYLDARVPAERYSDSSFVEYANAELARRGY